MLHKTLLSFYSHCMKKDLKEKERAKCLKARTHSGLFTLQGYAAPRGCDFYGTLVVDLCNGEIDQDRLRSLNISNRADLFDRS